MANQATMAGQISERKRLRLRAIAFGLFLVAATFAAYWPALHGQFVWDDDSWTTQIADLLHDSSGLLRMWTNLASLQQYYPLAGSSFWLDYHLWGFWTFPYHVENVLLHALGAVLFWRLLRRLEVPGAWLAAAIFALHPVMVESVAWITERKNVLSLVFFLGSLLAYGRFAGLWNTTFAVSNKDAAQPVPDLSDGAGRPAYFFALVLFLAALLAKATAVSLPAVILSLCWWKRGTIDFKRDVVPTLPFFALAAASGLVTRWVEHGQAGAQGPEWGYSLAERCLIAGRALWFYAAKLVWPANLAFMYPKWHLNTHSPGQWLYPAAAIAVLLAVWIARRRIGRGPAAALYCYVGAILPLLGFINAYGMRYSFVWNHWVYLPSLSLIALFSAWVVQTFGRRPAAIKKPQPAWRPTPPRDETTSPESLSPATSRFGAVEFCAVPVLALLGIITWRDCHAYRDSNSLWRATLARNPAAFNAHTEIGIELADRGRVDEAIDHYRKAVESEPDFAEAHGDLGIALLRKGDVSNAIVEMKTAVDLQPDRALWRNNYGNALLRQGRSAEALVQLRKALSLRPDLANVQFDFGVALLQAGQADEALAHLQKAVELRPNFAGHLRLAQVLVQKGRLVEAISHYEKALAIQPANPVAHSFLGHALIQTGQVREAISHYEAAIRAQPDSPFTLNNLAWVLATGPDASLRDGARAVTLAQRAAQISRNGDAMILETLAAAYAETGRFPEAVATAQQARDLARTRANQWLVDALKQQIALYQAGKPFREEPSKARL